MILLFKDLAVGRGLGQVGYIPVDNDKLYVMPDSVFHYFYVHRIAPSKKFRNAVIYGAKPESEEYIAKVKPFYGLKDVRGLRK